MKTKIIMLLALILASCSKPEAGNSLVTDSTVMLSVLNAVECHIAPSLSQHQANITGDHNTYSTILIGDSTGVDLCLVSQSPSTEVQAYPGITTNTMLSMLNASSNPEPAHVIIASAGINNLAGRQTSAQAVTAATALISSIRAKFPHAKISTYGIPANAMLNADQTYVVQNRDPVNTYLRSNVDCYVDTDLIFGISTGQAAPASFFFDGLHFTWMTSNTIKGKFKDQCGADI
jgi:hypothetical protein